MKLTKYVVVAIFLIILGVLLGRISTTSVSLLVTATPTPRPTPLAKYSIEKLKETSIVPAALTRGAIIKKGNDTAIYAFSMKFDPTLTGSDKKTVTGVMNIPNGEGAYPLIVMIRGFVDQSIYQPGVGTKNGADYFAKNGFITIAPDYLGYADSDSESGNVFESRFQTYTTTLTLLNSIATPDFEALTEGKWDGKNIFIWAHSNGGQITLTTLAVTGESYPTVLWAPVTKPFPYNVLYYTDESQDGGVFIRKELARFEEQYTAAAYSFTNYLKDIHAPIQFEQGTADDAVPVEWTRAMVAQLRKNGVEVTYNEYPGADHNLRPVWNEVIERDLNFYKKWMK